MIKYEITITDIQGVAGAGKLVQPAKCGSGAP